VVVIKKNRMYRRSLLYAFLLVIFSILGYLFLDSGFNTKTKVRVQYEDNSDVYYKVNYIDDSFDSVNNKYISNMVDTIDITYDYKNVISEYVNGFYRYSVDALLITYEDNVNDSLWEREYELVGENTVVLDANNINSIKILDSFSIDFNRFKDEIDEFLNNNNLDMKLQGYLKVRINIFESLKFGSLENKYDDNKVITVGIPLTSDTFKIDVNNIGSKNNCYEFTSNRTMNIVFLVIGVFFVSLALTLLVFVIRQFNIIRGMENEYHKTLKKILSKYDKNIVKVNRFYANKKYNMIYVDSIEELMDVSNKKNKMISFKEIKRGYESLFVIIDEDDAWIYKFKSNVMS
jgi:hypothetical protein